METILKAKNRNHLNLVQTTFVLLVMVVSSFALAANEPTAEDQSEAINRALRQSISERDRSQSIFQSNDSTGRPRDTQKPESRVKVELGDELGGGSAILDRNIERTESRGRSQTDRLDRIEQRLDAESRAARVQTKSDSMF